MTAKSKLYRLRDASRTTDKTPALDMGRRIFAPGPYGWGVISAVRGCEPVATYDVLFDDVGERGDIAGLELHDVSRAQLVSMACTVSDQMVAEAQIGARILASVRRAAESVAARAAYTAQVAALRVDPAYSFLVQGQDETGRLAAQNLSSLLANAFPGVAFTVKLSGRVLRTVWTDGPDAVAVEAYTARFNGGYVLDANAAWCEVFGSAPLTSVERLLSDEALALSIQVVWAVNDLATRVPTVADFRARRLKSVGHLSANQLESQIRRSVAQVAPMLKMAA